MLSSPRWGQFRCECWASHAVDGGQCGTAEGHFESGVRKSRVTDPARARLRVTEAAWAVFHAVKRAGCAGAGKKRRDECRSRSHWHGGSGRLLPWRGWQSPHVCRGLRMIGFADGDHLNSPGGQQGAEPDVKGRLTDFSNWPLSRWAPVSSPPWAASRTTTKRGVGAGAGTGVAAMEGRSFQPEMTPKVRR